MISITKLFLAANMALLFLSASVNADTTRRLRDTATKAPRSTKAPKSTKSPKSTKAPNSLTSPTNPTTTTTTTATTTTVTPLTANDDAFTINSPTDMSRRRLVITSVTVGNVLTNDLGGTPPYTVTAIAYQTAQGDFVAYSDGLVVYVTPPSRRHARALPVSGGTITFEADGDVVADIPFPVEGTIKVTYTVKDSIGATAEGTVEFTLKKPGVG